VKKLFEKGKDGFYNKYVKRGLDVACAAVLSIPAGAIVGACYAAIKMESHGPAFFVQERPGINGQIFKIYKLRTMIVETEKDGRPLSDMERMTKSGSIIRACSFDELPQILNVLKGEMSFIGPRPLLVQYLPLYSEEQARRHEVRPGITGWAQVNGRNGLSWEDKFNSDVWYVDNVSFGLDAKIFAMTIWNVLQHSGINAGVNDTMKPFTGCAIED
jgi:lipopolysaccharide/colanic/teichoic acid biosynthesis glycosyltransferase